MDELVTLIMGNSTTLDAEVIIRLCLVFMGLELFSVACAMLGGMKGR